MNDSYYPQIGIIPAKPSNTIDIQNVLISASFLLTLHIVVYMKYVPNIQKGKVKIHPKDDKFKIVSSKESSLETK